MMDETGVYKCYLCGRRWHWYREPVTQFVLVCPECSNGKQVVLDWVPAEERDACKKLGVDVDG